MGNISSNSVKTLIRQVLSIVIQLCTIIIIARSLGVDGNGQYALAILVPTFLSMFLSLSLNTSNIYFIGKGKYSYSSIYTTSLLITLIIIITGLVFSFIFISLYHNILFPSLSFKVLATALVIFPFTLLNVFHLSFLQATEDFTSFNKLSLAQPILLLTLILLLTATGSLGLYQIIIVSLISPLVALILNIIYTHKKGFVFNINNYSNELMKSILSYGIRSHLSNLVAFINYRSDIFLISILSTITNVGLYSVAVQIIERLWIFAGAINAVVFPRFIALNNNTTKRLALITKSFRIVIIITFSASLLLLLTGNYLLNILFGKEYSEAYYAIIILVPGVVLAAGSKILANAIAAKGKPELNMYTSSLVMIINIVLNIILIPKFGILGAASATSFAYIVNVILRIIIFSRLERNFLLKSLYITKKDFDYLHSKLLLLIQIATGKEVK